MVPHRKVGDHPRLTCGLWACTGPIKICWTSVLDWVPIVIVAVDECADTAERLNQSDVSGLQGSCATYATFLHA